MTLIKIFKKNAFGLGVRKLKGPRAKSGNTNCPTNRKDTEGFSPKILTYPMDTIVTGTVAFHYRSFFVRRPAKHPNHYHPTLNKPPQTHQSKPSNLPD